MNEKTKLVKEKTGMNIKDLAKEIGYTEKTIVCALRGKQRAGYDLAKILAEKTGMSPLYFMEDDHGEK
jgi:predicted transcriptional regulator